MKECFQLKGAVPQTPHLFFRRFQFVLVPSLCLVILICAYFVSALQVNGVRWHQCPYCSKEFKKPSDLVRHIRIHTHEKPYKCTQCFRAFAVKSTLTAHIKTHSGVKDYKCEECNKLFSTQGSLKVHLRLHTGAVALFSLYLPLFFLEQQSSAVMTAEVRIDHVSGVCVYLCECVCVSACMVACVSFLLPVKSQKAVVVHTKL